MPKSIREEGLLTILEKVSPGTPFREAIDSIMRMRNGALILVADLDQANQVVQTGFFLDTQLTPQRLVELAKMDRAIVVSEDLEKIFYANAYLVPDPSIPSNETGTRHLTAEKVAKQLGCATIAISESKMGRVTIYYGHLRYVLPDIAALSARVNQALRVLEQYRITFDELSRELTALELEGRVLPYHVANIIQNIVQMLDTEDEIRRYFVELGEEKELMELLLEWLMLGLRDQLELLVEDFRATNRNIHAIIEEIRHLPPEDLLSTEKIMEVLGYAAGEEALDAVIPSKGYRVLDQIPRLPRSISERLIEELGSLKAILRAGEKELMEIKGIAEVRARAVKSGLKRLKQSLATLGD
jgi:diadenylate cyclase